MDENQIIESNNDQSKHRFFAEIDKIVFVEEAKEWRVYVKFDNDSSINLEQVLVDGFKARKEEELYYAPLRGFKEGFNTVDLHVVSNTRINNSHALGFSIVYKVTKKSSGEIVIDFGDNNLAGPELEEFIKSLGM